MLKISSKIFLSFVFIFSFLFAPYVSFATASAATQIFDYTELDRGLISVNYQVDKDVQTKVMIAKDDKKYFYNLKSADNFPLQFGNGEYTVAVLELVEGNKYKAVKLEKVTLHLTNENDVFLNSIQNIKWNEEMEAIKKAKELTKDAKTDREKVTAIYNYIVKHINYDYDKANTITTGYIPVIDETFKEADGICYDYASLFAAMLRSVQVPTKLVMGYKNDIKSYHAWNTVYLKDTNEWITIDTTYDATLLDNKQPYSMIKDPGQYTADKEY